MANQKKLLSEFTEAENAYVKEATNDPEKRNRFREAYSILQALTLMHYQQYPDWENLPIQEKVWHGHLKGALYCADSITTGRWHYWLDVRTTQEVENKPIPQVEFLVPGNDGYELTQKMLKQCLNVPDYHSSISVMYNLVDWLLYGYGSPLVDDISHIPVTQSAYWYEHFRPQLMLMNPADYFVQLASELYAGSFNANSFYPTPGHVVELMTKLTYQDADPETVKYEAVYDPTCGTGVMLLYASNYSLQVYGQDIDPFMTKLALLNGYHYVPWMVEMDDTTRDLLERLRLEKGGEMNSVDLSALLNELHEQLLAPVSTKDGELVPE